MLKIKFLLILILLSATVNAQTIQGIVKDRRVGGKSPATRKVAEKIPKHPFRFWQKTQQLAVKKAVLRALRSETLPPRRSWVMQTLP